MVLPGTTIRHNKIPLFHFTNLSYPFWIGIAHMHTYLDKTTFSNFFTIFMFGSYESTPSASTSSISWPSITSAASSIRNFLCSRKNNSLPGGKVLLEAPMHFPLRWDTFFLTTLFCFSDQKIFKVTEIEKEKKGRQHHRSRNSPF